MPWCLTHKRKAKVVSFKRERERMYPRGIICTFLKFLVGKLGEEFVTIAQPLSCYMYRIVHMSRA